MYLLQCGWFFKSIFVLKEISKLNLNLGKKNVK